MFGGEPLLETHLEANFGRAPWSLSPVGRVKQFCQPTVIRAIQIQRARTGRRHTKKWGDNVQSNAPAVPFKPTTEVTLQIPAGSSGLRSATGALLAAPVTTVFQAGGRSRLRVEQLLAQLGYLPMTWTPQSAGAGGAAATSYAQRRAADDAPAGGMLTWQSGYPSALTTASGSPASAASSSPGR
jgi:hypothetical protein